MSNIQKYDEFINENRLIKRAKFETINLSIRALFKLFRFIFIFSENFSNGIKDLEHEFSELIKFIRFIGINLNKINFDKQSEEEIRTLFASIREKYEKKFKRSLIDDIIHYVNSLVISNKRKDPNKPDTKTIIEMKKLILLINPKEIEHIDIDPFGEEEWG